MKNIINWTFGSVFRTFGRILAYLCVGALLGIILSKNDVKISDLLGIERVNATTTDRWALNLPNIVDGRWYDCTGTNTCDTQMATTSVAVNSRSYIAGDTTGTIASNGMLLQYYSPTNFKQGYLYSVGLYMCSNKNLSDVSFEVYSNLSGNRGKNNTVYSSSARTSLSNEPFAIGSSVGSYCYLYQGSFVTAQDTSWVQLRFKKSSGSITGFTPALISITVEGVGPYSTIIENAVSNAISNKGLATSTDINNMKTEIENKQQETTDAVNDVNDSINDDDVGESSEAAESLFNDFEDTDFGLTGIVTAPLDMIRSITSATCSPVVVGGGTGLLQGVSFELPCLTPLYRQWFPDFLTLYQTITFGLIAYKICVDILSWVRSFRNPEEDRLEVIDL